MDPVVAPAAPAQPTAPTTVSASIDAVNRNDFDAFDLAELGKRTGAPVADVPITAEGDDPPPAAPTSATAPATDGRTVSARQQKTNDAIREAVTRATKESADRIADLERQLTARPPAARAADPPPAAPPAPKTPEYKRIMALEGAPKLADFDSVEEHAFAAAQFALAVHTREQAAIERDRATTHSRTVAEMERVDGFVTQITEAKNDTTFVAAIDAAKTASPEFAEKLNALKPFSALQEGEKGRPINAIAEQVYDSPVVKAVLLHFAQHPDELARLEAGPAQFAAIPIEHRTVPQVRQHLRWIEHEFKRLEGRLAGTAAPDSTAAPAAPAADAAPRSPITAAPPPPPTLRAAGSTSDPKAAALARGDFAEYDRVDVQERLAKLSPR